MALRRPRARSARVLAAFALVPVSMALLAFGPAEWVVSLHDTRWSVSEVLPLDGRALVALGSSPRGARGRGFGQLAVVELATGRKLAERITDRGAPRLLGRGEEDLWIVDADGVASIGVDLERRTGIAPALESSRWDGTGVWVDESGGLHFSSLDGFTYRVGRGGAPSRLPLGAVVTAARGGARTCHPDAAIDRIGGEPLLARSVLCSPHQGTLRAGGDVFVAHQTLLGDEGTLVVTRASTQGERRWTQSEDSMFGDVRRRRVHAALLHGELLVLLGGEVELDEAWVLALGVADGSVRYAERL